MIDVTLEQVSHELSSDDWYGDKNPRTIMITANTWLLGKGVKYEGTTPPPAIITAVALVAKAVADGEMLSGRSDGVVVSKSTTAGEVSVSKTYASGEDGKAISSYEEQAEMLIKPYIFKGRNNYRVDRA